jgi:hypothetical protein
MSHWALVIGGLALAGCARSGDRAETTRDTGGMMGHMDSGGMGMGNMQSMTMMSGMRAHMDSMMQMSPQQMQAMMAMHEQMMSRMMDGMGADMRGIKMPGTPEWSALTDSVKQDLADLPNLKGQQLSARMRAHADRVKRLIAMHAKTMGK